jgi:HEAT repeat protein
MATGRKRPAQPAYTTTACRSALKAHKPGNRAQLEVGSYHSRRDAARQLCLDGLDDPQLLPALLGRLERDPSPQVRAAVAEYLRPAVGLPAVLSAMRSAAAQDEDAQVRWAARCAQM